MKRNVKQKLKTSRRMILIVGVSSILGLTIAWFLFYTFSGTDKMFAGEHSSQPYVEDENLTDFEVSDARVRSADDPVVQGTARYKNTKEISTN